MGLSISLWKLQIQRLACKSQMLPLHKEHVERKLQPPRVGQSQHDHANTTSSVFIDVVLGIDASSERMSAVVVDVVVQLAVARSVFLLL